MSLLERAEMSAPLLPPLARPLALWRRPILGNYFSTELALYASFRDYRRCRRLRRRQPRPDGAEQRSVAASSL